MDDGFRVDLAALTAAADGVTATVRSVTESPVHDIDAPPAAFGHERLAATVSGFCDRWQPGVVALVSDVREIADRLGRSAEAYRRVEQDIVSSMVERTSGPDPAAV